MSVLGKGVCIFLCLYVGLCVCMCILMVTHFALSDEEEDDEMDFSGVKTVNLQVSHTAPVTFSFCVIQLDCIVLVHVCRRKAYYPLILERA